MTDSERDLATIAAVLAEPEERPEPVPRVKARPTGRRPVPVPVIETDDYDDDSDAIADDDLDGEGDDGSGDDTAIEAGPVAQPSIGCVGRVPVVFGVDVEADPELIASRARFAPIEERHRLVAAQLAALREKCGIAPGAPIPDQHKLHVMIANAIIAGTGTLDPADYSALSGTAIAEKTLREAGEKVSRQVTDARFRAITRCGPKVLAALAPEMEAMARAWVAILKASAVLDAKMTEFNAAGWRMMGGSQIPALPIGPNTDITLNPYDCAVKLRELLAAGLLTEDDVAGLPGFGPC